MPSHTLTCPHCHKSIDIDEALSSEVEQKLKTKFEVEHRHKDEELQKKLQEVEAEKKKVEQDKVSVDKLVEEKLQAEKEAMWKKAQKAAEEKQGTEIKDMKAQVEEKEKKLKEAEQHELELRKKTRELEDKEKGLELELQRKLDAEKKTLEEKMRQELGEEQRRKLSEKDQQLEQMRKTIAELQRKSEQGSSQIQGEAQEEDLKQLLSSNFSSDIVEDVPQGIKGADLIQTVRSSLGHDSGIILWESKSTKNWSEDWIKKLKDDQGIAKADLCVLVSAVLPEDVQNFGFRNGIWITSYPFVLPLAAALRIHLSELQKVKKSMVGREEKMEYLYEYLSGAQFKNRIENIVMAFTGMKSDLESEKRSMQRIWSKREKEIDRVVLNTSGFYGDLQGIIGASLPTIQSLELPEGEENGEE